MDDATQQSGEAAATATETDNSAASSDTVATAETPTNSENSEANDAGVSAPDTEAANEAAQAQGFADAATQQAAEAAAAKPKRKKRAPRKRTSGFELKANDPEALAELKLMATENQLVAFAVGDHKGHDKAVAPIMSGLNVAKDKVINASKVSFSGANLEQSRGITHVFVLNNDAKAPKPVLHLELPAPITLSPGEQLQFGVGGIAFRVPPAEAS